MSRDYDSATQVPARLLSDLCKYGAKIMVSHSCWRSSWGVFLYSLILLTTPLSVALHLGTRSIKDCLPVHFDKFEHSTWTPNPPDQIPEYTIYQQFYTSNLTANFTQRWSRWPHPLHDSEGRYDIPPLDPYVTDGHLYVNASITLRNIKGEIDDGNYMIVVSTACASDNMTFEMRISECGIKDIPRPVELTENPVIVPDHNRPEYVHLSFQFFGNNQKTDYRFQLTRNGEPVCDDSSSSDSGDKFSCSDSLRFTCYRTTERQCNATFHVNICNYTHQDSGLFCVAASSIASNSTGNTSCVRLDIQQPRELGVALGAGLGVGLGVGVPMLALGVVCIVFIVHMKRKAPSNEEDPLLGDATRSNGSQGASSVSGSACDDNERDHPVQSSMSPNPSPIWQQIPDGAPPLNERQLMIASRQLTEWKPLARILGLDEPTIIAIEDDNRSNMGEQRYQMLYKWSQSEGENATLKTLIRCVEQQGTFQSREMARKIIRAFPEQ